MKPVYLSIEGINSFVSAQEINFSEAADGNIFCICGPTGSGKTTILDSVILALYGKGDRGVKDDYINLSCDKGTIVFRFELNDCELEVRRVFSRKAGGDRAYLTNVSEGDMIADGVEKVNAEMQKLIGLSRGDFTQVVILEQGKFGKFLTADKGERNKTIAQLFSLDKFDGLSTKFNAVAVKFDNLVSVAEAKAEHLKDLSAKLISEKKAELKASEKQLSDEEKTLKKLEKEISQIALVKQKYDDMKAAKTALAAAQAAYNAEKAVEKELSDRQNKLTEFEKTVAEAKENLEKAKAVLSKTETAKSETEHILKLENKRKELRVKFAEKEELRRIAEKKAAAENAKKSEMISGAKELFCGLENKSTGELALHFNALKASLGASLAADKIAAENYENSLSKLSGLRSKFGSADANISVVKAKFEQAEKEEKECEKLYETARRDNAAHAVALSLKDGDCCPVCGGVFHGGGHKSRGATESELETLKKNYSFAAAEREKSAAELKMICLERDRLFAEVANAEKEAAELLKKIKCTQNADDIDSALNALGKDFDNACKAVEVLSRIADAEKSAENYLKEEQKLKVDAEFILQDGKALKEEIERREGDIKNMFGETKIDEAEKSARETVLSAETLIKKYEAEKSELAEKIQDHRVRSAKIDADIANSEKAVAAAGNVEFDESKAEKTEAEKKAADEKRSALIAVIAALKNEIEAGEKGLKEKAALESEIKYNAHRRDTAKTLSNLFRGNRFLEYVEEEYIREFTSRASEKLFELSGGKFSLDYSEDEKKSDFLVCDHLRGGEKRKVRTLSGGETFLASLSMAIAISEQIAHNKSYDFFFLDEGFGTLDENAIDTVAAALYKLAEETMVGLVSHRSELVEKIPSHIKVLPATEAEGSRVVIEKM